MKHKETVNAAIAWAEDARRAALQRERQAGEPRSPGRPRPGREAEFQAARADAATLDTIVKELKTARLIGQARRAVRLADRALDILVGVGLVGLAVLGLAALAAVLGYPDTVVRVAALGALGAALARTVIAGRRK